MANAGVRLIGLDPGLGATGWGVIDAAAGTLTLIACGTVTTNAKAPLAERLVQLADGLQRIIEAYAPAEAAVEETFVNRNPTSTLRLGQARGVVLLAPARAGLPVSEYTPNRVKKAVVGVGHASKAQIQAMVRILLPAAAAMTADAADALAVAICHAHFRHTAALAAAAPA